MSTSRGAVVSEGGKRAPLKTTSHSAQCTEGSNWVVSIVISIVRAKDGHVSP
jgi:hypothetical protein